MKTLLTLNNDKNILHQTNIHPLQNLITPPLSSLPCTPKKEAQ